MKRAIKTFWFSWMILVALLIICYCLCAVSANDGFPKPVRRTQKRNRPKTVPPEGKRTGEDDDRDSGIKPVRKRRSGRKKRQYRNRKRYIITRTTEPEVIMKPLIGDDPSVTLSLLSEPLFPAASYENSRPADVIPTRTKRIYGRYTNLHSDYHQRYWIINGRKYSCQTCIGCRHSSFCQQRLIYGKERQYQALKVGSDNGCYESTTQKDYEQGDKYIRFIRGREWNCVCEGGLTHRVSCRVIAQCKVDGITHNRGDQWIKISSYGYRMKCFCYGEANIAKWKCATNLNSFDIGPDKRQEYRQLTISHICLDRMGDGRTRKIGERWSRMSRFGTIENCECERGSGFNVISCITIKEEDGSRPEATNSSKTIGESSEIEYCIDEGTQQRHMVDIEWTKSVGMREIRCRCVKQNVSKPTIICDDSGEENGVKKSCDQFTGQRLKPNEYKRRLVLPATESSTNATTQLEKTSKVCVIGEENMGRVGDVVELGHSWNTTRANGSAVSCKCVKKDSIVCSMLCIDHETYFSPGTNITRGSQSCRCNESGVIFCAENVSKCDSNPCWRGVSCFESDQAIDGYVCGPCPRGYKEDGRVCAPISCDDNPCFRGVACLDHGGGGFTCGRCPIGFLGNGTTCMDVRVRCSQHHPCADNVNCVDTTVGVECDECPAGYYGDGYKCEKIIERCNTSACAENVVCEDIEDGVRCGRCPPGFAGDGRVCKDARERCKDHPCADDVICTDTLAGVKCGPCPTGFSGDGRTCDDVRIRCSSEPCHVLVTCTNTNIGVHCGNCPTGFVGDGFECENVKVRCDQNPCATGVDCTVTEVGIECGPCPSGYKGDGHTCVLRLPSCNSHSCFEGVACFNTETGLRCGDCPPGFSGDGVTCTDVRKRCRDTPCYTGVTCADTEIGAECGPCPQGYEGDGIECEDFRPRCSDKPCHPKVKCNNTKIGVSCGACPRGFSGDGFTCVDIRERCRERPCFRGSPCRNTIDGITCGPCPTGYSGDGRKCIDVRLRCSDRPCYTGVSCVNIKSGVICGDCPPGFEGDGMACIDVRERCDQSPCFPGVDCTETLIGVKCGLCPSGYEGNGKNCKNKRERCRVDTCFEGVECTNTETGVICGPCPTGFSGNGFYCADMRLRCVDNHCHPNVSCRDTDVGVECGRCPVGMSGDGYICTNFPLCSETSCPRNSVCRDVDQKAICVACPPGSVAFGNKCSEKKQRCSDNPCYPEVACEDTEVGVVCDRCPVGYSGNGKFCVDVRKRCDDVIHSCFAGVPCLDTEFGAVCGPCPPGYLGDGAICTHVCKEKNNPCFKRARCYYTSSGTKCGRCPRGMVGDGFHCERKKSCRDNPCYPGVNCIETRAGRITCGSCPMGFQGNGIACADINECITKNPCSPLTKCTNTFPGFKCGKCPEGYRELLINDDPFDIARQTCESLDPCKTDNGGCIANSQCIYTPGTIAGSQHRCGECNPGYRGNQTAGCHLVACNDCCEEAYCSNHAGNLFTCICMSGWAGDGIFCGPDKDFDGFPDVKLPCERKFCAADNCPNISNTGQEDSDADGFGNYCDDDADNDEYPNEEDNCWLIANPDQRDSDGDTHGDLCDNCPFVANYFQIDTDGDMKGDKCDEDIDNDGVMNAMDICANMDGESVDYDGDSIGDLCDNCPRIFNIYQRDVDQDGVGDMCDTGMDSDGDGVQDNRDNCVFVVNPNQLDTDGDGIGDSCDEDDDGDGVMDFSHFDDFNIEVVEINIDINVRDRRYPVERGTEMPWGGKDKYILDNCRLISNPNQTDTDGDGFGDACEKDFDGDGIEDKDDVCFQNPKIHRPDFTNYMTVLLDPSGDAQMDPYWVVFNEGTEMLQTINSDPGLAVGRDTFQGVDYSGTVQVNTKADDDYFGIVFSYQSNARFYAVLWKQTEQSYWWPNPFRATAQTGLQLKVIDSKTGPGSTLRNAIWHTGDTEDQVRLLWHDEGGDGWKDFVPYRFYVIHRPRIGYIRVLVKTGSQTLADSGKIIDSTLKGGRLGVFAFSQEHIIYSQLHYQCNDTIPWDYFVGSNEETSLLNKKKF